MLNKNDPLIGAVQEVMKKNQAEREAIKAVNEKFGIHDRKALPHERQHEWDTAYKKVLTEGLHPNQVKLDMNKNNKLDKQDFKMLRAKKPVEEATDGDTTSPSSMGIKGPDYASGTPDYAKSKEQTVNRAVKTSLPAGTVANSIKEEMTDAEKAKREKIVMSMKKKMAGFKERYGKRAKDVMYATATKQAMKEAADSASSMPQVRGQTTYGNSAGTSAMTGMPRRSAPADRAGTSAMTGMPTRSAPADRVGTSAITGMPSRSASTRQASTGAQIGGARPSPSVGGNAGALARQAAGQRTSNAIRNLNTPGLRTTNTVNAAGQAKGPNVGLPQKSTVASTGQKVNAATQTRGPNAASGAAPKPAAKAPVPTAKPVKTAAVAKPKIVAKPKAATGAATPPVKKMSQAQRSYIARQKERQGP